MDSKNFNRRSFFKLALGAAVISPILMNATTAQASGCPTTAPAGKKIGKAGEGMGKTLEYVEDAKTSKNAKYKAGANCGNCKFYNDKKAEGGYAPCTMMGMAYVTTCGWCKSYLKKA